MVAQRPYDEVEILGWLSEHIDAGVPPFLLF
jgi:hypothetical protein